MRDTVVALSRQYLEGKNQRYERDILNEDQLTHRLSILVGPRGVGKTTLIIQHLLKLVNQDILDTKILYVPADHFLIADYSLYDIADNFQKHGGETIAFDEIHKYEGWSQELKSIYDSFPNLSIIASGSSALEIHKGSHDLVRRSIVSEIVGLSLREYIELQLKIELEHYSLDALLLGHEKIAKQIINTVENHQHKILPLFNHFLQFGYYPYFLELKNDSLYSITLEQNIHATLESDLPAIYPHLTGTSIKKIKQLLTFIAENVPFTKSFSDLKNYADISDLRTLKNYLYYLEQSCTIRMLTSASSKLKKYDTPAKIYIDNTNQLYALCPNPENSGMKRELFFTMMLSLHYELLVPLKGDFLVNNEYTFEIGGKNKSFKQIAGQNKAYIVQDDIEVGVGNKIPLWLFGFLY